MVANERSDGRERALAGGKGEVFQLMMGGLRPQPSLRSVVAKGPVALFC